MDVIVVGAGAAGLAAAKTLRGAGLRVAVLEAKHRTGGRAWTDAATFGVPLDWGCHWLHSADVNPFTKMAQTWGFAHRTGTGWGRLHLVEPAHVSTLDLARYRDTGENWPVADGYGALVARYGADLEVALGTPARRIDWGGGRGVRVRTARGTLDARAVVVTVSTGVLAAGTLRFEPPLPQWKLAAIDAVPLGYAGKIAFAFDRDVFDLPSTTYAIPERGAPRTLSFQIRPFARSLAVGYVGGHFCRELEAAGEVAMIAFARERLVDMFGAGVPRRIVKSACVRWGEDPDVRGGYSCARPGRAEQRAALARPVGERVFFAGEACSREFFSTAHGALLNGVEVGRAVADYLNGRITRTAQE